MNRRKAENTLNTPPVMLALAGNPNVGKSTVFNTLTGLKQHTGNWTGKTVETARGSFIYNNRTYIITDLPGTYSLSAHSAEEQVARDYICFGESDGVIIVCDACCLERNLNLVLQILEITPKAMLCVNLLDEAEKKKISIDLAKLEELLGIPVCGTAARSGAGINAMLDRIDEMTSNSMSKAVVIYDDPIEKAVSLISPHMNDIFSGRLPKRFAALKILEHSYDIIVTADKNTCGALSKNLNDPSTPLGAAYSEACKILKEAELDTAALRDSIVSSVIKQAEATAAQVTSFSPSDSFSRDRKIDNILTHRIWGIPVMLGILAVIFFITIKGANYPSAWLSSAFGTLGEKMRSGLISIGAADWLTSLLIDGIYCVLTWVASVMLPPMAIFFPLFTLLEDVGYLPRAAFNLDRFFSRSHTCGKQALTMAMGLGCNSVGITGCRIIDSPRERLIAIITNSFMPCNGKFPTLIILISVFFAAGSFSGAASAFVMTGFIILSAALTFALSRILSSTLLKGEPSSFALELPPYRRPQFGKVLMRSLLDRTVFVLGRAVTVAAPAGLVIWLLANITIGDANLLSHMSAFLDPFASLLGLDGVILLAFILGFPANEIVLPIMLMIYMGENTLVDLSEPFLLGNILRDNGWTWQTALCTMIFMLCHFPCSTSCLTIKKETGSWKWTLVSIAVPTATGFILCGMLNLIFSI
ncbi:MAG: ferrous iron transport protein B [Oscillospiraceae bacterium]|nr:ferrous iron transport protein B [Oscillospiraceae bacterium]